MTESDALEQALSDLGSRGYDLAKLGVARNVLGRFVRFLGARGIADANTDDASLFLEKVGASGASEKAVAVFRQVMDDVHPILAGIRARQGAAAHQEVSDPEIESLAVAPPEPPAQPSPVPAVISEDPPPIVEPLSAEPPAVEPERRSARPEFESFTSSPPPLASLPSFGGEQVSGIAWDSMKETEPALPAEPVKGSETESGTERSIFDLPIFPTETTALPSGIDWEPLAPDLPDVPPFVEPVIPVLPAFAESSMPVSSDAVTLQPEMAPLFEPPDASIASLGEGGETAAATSEALPMPLEVPPELVAILTPRLTAEIPHVDANIHFEESASNLLGPAAEEPSPSSQAISAEDPAVVKRALVRENFPAVFPTLLGQLEGNDDALKAESRELFREAGILAAPHLISALETCRGSLAAEIYPILMDIPGPEVPRLTAELLRFHHADPVGSVLAGGEVAIRLLLRRFPEADEHEREPLGNLIEASPELAIAPLLEIQDSSNPELRGYAIRTLGAFGRVEGIPGLARSLESADDDMRASSAMALVTIGRPAIDSLGGVLLRSNDLDVQYDTAKALGLIAHADGVPYLVQALGEGRVGYTVADSLVKIGRSSREPLESLVTHSDASVRYLVAEALGRIGDEAAKPALQSLLGDPDTNVQDAARQSLVKLGVPAGELTPPSPPRELFTPPPPVVHENEIAEAKRRADAGDREGGLSLISEIFERHPDDPAAGGLAAELEISLGRNDRAAATYEKILRRRDLLSEDEIVHCLLEKGKCHERIGQAWEAVACLDQILFIDSGHPEAISYRVEWEKRLES